VVCSVADSSFQVPVVVLELMLKYDRTEVVAFKSAV
jgi:hypothetical protein